MPRKAFVTLFICVAAVFAVAGGQVAATEPLTIRICGWNVQSDFTPKQHESDPDLIAQQIAAKDDVDLWGLCEVLGQTALDKFEKGAEEGEGSDFESLLSGTGGRDRLAIIYDTARFELLGVEELGMIQLSPGLRAPLVAHFRGRTTGTEFLFMVNHLKRGGAQNPVRIEQARRLHEWARDQRLPVIAVGDWNMDYDVELGDLGVPHRDRAYDELTRDGVWKWLRPEPLLKTNADPDFNTVLDFVFVANAPFGWFAESHILEREEDRHATENEFSDDDRESDHRPVDAILSLRSRALASATSSVPTPAAAIERSSALVAEEAPETGESSPEFSAGAAPLSLCSANIQFLGNSKQRDNAAFGTVLAAYDLVVVQELVAPPFEGTFPDGTPFRPDPEAAAFFEVMRGHGFEFVLSDEDTGPGDRNHLNSTATEWWVVFYNPARVRPAAQLPHGFLSETLAGNDDFDRVPYAFPFRDIRGKVDFVLVPVHLRPGAGPEHRERRKHELATIGEWIESQNTQEKDFVILGDMNIENAKELASATPPGYLSLNDECRATNTNPASPKPYDHVMYDPTKMAEIDTDFDLVVVDLVAVMHDLWSSEEPYPGDPYDHNEFRKHYSDHDPVEFRIAVPVADDD